MTTNDIKKTLGENTEKLEAIVTPYYTNLEPWQRGLLIVALTTFLLISIYLLTKKETPTPRELTEEEKRKIEALAEQKILKRAEFLRKLQQ